MADENNPGQFGNRNDTEEQTREGGHANSGSFGSENAADPSLAGKEGSQTQPHDAKVEGGRNSHQDDGNNTNQ